MVTEATTNAISPELITAALTVFGGVLVISVTEILKSIFLDPISKINQHIGTIIDRTIFYSANLTNYNDQEEEIISMRSHLRSASSQLRAKKEALKLYGLWSFLRLVPSSETVDEVARELIGLSNRIPTRNRATEQDFISLNDTAINRIATVFKFNLH